MKSNLAIIAALLAACLTACTDPGCIRNSECGDGYRCEQSACVPDDVDGGTRRPVDEDAGRE